MQLPFQENIIPKLKSQIPIEPTLENLRDVSLCVWLASGGVTVTQRDPLPDEDEAVFDIQGIGFHYAAIESAVIDIFKVLYSVTGNCPDYSHDLSLIERVINKDISPYIILQYRHGGSDVCTVRLVASKDSYNYDFPAFQPLPSPYPALAWCAVYLMAKAEGV